MDVPWRRDFDAARDPYTGRNALGITGVLVYEAPQDGTPYERQDGAWVPASSGGGGGLPEAPVDGKTYGRKNAAWSLAVEEAGTGGIIYGRQSGGWAALHLIYATLDSPVLTGDPRAPTPATADNDKSIATTEFVKAQGYLTSSGAAVAYQPLDADLTSIAGYGGTGTWLYRSAANTWSAVSLGSGLTFTAGTLDAPVFTSGAKGEVPASGGGTANFLRADGTWTTPAGAGDVTQAGTNTFTGSDYFNLGSNLPLVVGHSAKIATTTAVDVNGTSGKEGLASTRWSNDTTGVQLLLRKSRGSTVGTNTVVASGDTLGKISFVGNHGTGFQTGGPAVSGVCNSSPFGTNTPGYVLIEAATIGGALVNAATFKDTGCALLGTTTNDDAATGWVGQYKESVILIASRAAIATGTQQNITSLSLEAGDWDVEGVVSTYPQATTTLQSLFASISQTSATLDQTSGRQSVLNLGTPGVTPGLGFLNSLVTPTVRKSFASTTPVYLVTAVNFGTSTMEVFGALRARRVR